MNQLEIDQSLLAFFHFVIGIPLIIAVVRARSMAKKGIAPPPSGLRSW